MKEPTFEIRLVEDEIDLLISGLRFLELNHPQYPQEFTDLLNNISLQVKQTSLFDLSSAQKVSDIEQTSILKVGGKA